MLSELLANGEKVSAQKIRDGVKANEAPEPEPIEGDFLAFCREMLDQFERRGQIATFRAYQTAVRKLADFTRRKLGTRELAYEALSVSFFRDFQTYLVQVKKNKPNTVHKNVASIRTLLYAAIKEGLFPQSKNPFFHITLKKEKVHRDKLDIEEIRKIEELEIEEETLLWHVRNWFMFAFYAGGVRFSDVALMQWKHVKGERLSYRMKKTNEATSIGLVPQALEILEKYQHRNTGPEARVFSILDGYNISTPAKVHQSYQHAECAHE